MAEGAIHFSIDNKEFNRNIELLLKKHEVKFKLAVTDASFKMQKLAQRKALTGKYKTGKLAQGITPEIINQGLTGEVTSHQNYSEFVEKGTRPHHIRVIRKKILAGNSRFAKQGVKISNGWAIYGKKAQHPGTRPKPFMEPAFNVAKKIFIDNIKKIFN